VCRFQRLAAEVQKKSPDTLARDGAPMLPIQ
jgi:hypothetical protein